MAINPRFNRLGRWAIVTFMVAFSLTAVGAGPTAQAAGNYRSYADAGIAALQGFYNSGNGQWNIDWWHSANALETTIDYSSRTGSTAYRDDISNTFDKNSGGNFTINSFYDDEGWWAMAWVKAYDLTGETRYLNAAKTVFSDMTGAWDSTCNGGIWWTRDRNYKNAITNELFLSLAARLHNRTPGDSGSGSYQDWAEREWNWFNASGLINGSPPGLVLKNVSLMF